MKKININGEEIFIDKVGGAKYIEIEENDGERYSIRQEENNEFSESYKGSGASDIWTEYENTHFNPLTIEEINEVFNNEHLWEE